MWQEGCGEVLIIDGNMKNHHDVCLAEYAGYTEYDGLPGKVCTGCPNTPAYMSRYCDLHKPTVALPQVESPEGVCTSTLSEDQVGLIIGVTRSSTMYHVRNTILCCWLYCYIAFKFTWSKVVWLGRPETHSSWQPESSLSPKIVEEYEKGVQQEISIDSFVSGGQTISTLSRNSDTAVNKFRYCPFFIFLKVFIDILSTKK